MDYKTNRTPERPFPELDPAALHGLVSPTGLEGICQKALPLWGIPFHGMVEAA